MAPGTGKGAAPTLHMLACLVVALHQNLGVVKVTKHFVSSLEIFCTFSSLPVEGEWTDWLQWAQCSTTCGPGTRDRTRSHTAGLPCSGSDTHTEGCQGIPGNFANVINGCPLTRKMNVAKFLMM